MTICRHGLRDVQDYAATVWGDSKVTLGSAVMFALTNSASNRVIRYCILEGLSKRGVSEFSSCSTPPEGMIDPGSEQ